jgi:fumarate hydratase subunit alpha
MRFISSKEISDALAQMCASANYELPGDVLSALTKAMEKESGIAKDIIKQIIQNADIAKKEKIPLCQDTGTANVFIKLGREVFVEGDDIYKAVNAGVSKGYVDNYLRKSIVSDPLERKNTRDNTPANIYIEITDGAKVEMTFMPKGGGSENASALKMLAPAAGWEGIKEFVISSVKDKGKNACPPLIIGIGIGGDFASSAFLAKKALLRKIGSQNLQEVYRKKEEEILQEINNLGIGPMGLGGNTTALAVFIETKAAHIASLPAAVNFQCHSCRRKTVVL